MISDNDKERAVWEGAQAAVALLESTPPLETGNYLLKAWGAADSDPKFKEKYGQANEFDIEDEVANGYVWWFDTEQQRNAFEKELREFCETLPKSTLVSSHYDGGLVKKRLVAVVTLNYLGKKYVVEKMYGYGYPPNVAVFDWEENNFSCDCNRILIIDRQHPDAVTEEELENVKCTENIFVSAFHFELLD